MTPDPKLEYLGRLRLRVNALEIALRNGDIMSPPDPSKPWKNTVVFLAFLENMFCRIWEFEQ